MVSFTKLQSDEALARITELLPFMERIGRLPHGVMLPIGTKEVKEGTQVWKPWTDDERRYMKGVRNIFAHARCRVLPDGGLRVKDQSQKHVGKPEIDGLSFDSGISAWEWTVQEFQQFSQRLMELTHNRFRVSFQATVVCQICGQSVDGRDYLSCGHVTYQEGSQPALFRKPSGGTLIMTTEVSYTDNASERQGFEGVITDEGLEMILQALEWLDKLACEAETKGIQLYEITEDMNPMGPTLL